MKMRAIVLEDIGDICLRNIEVPRTRKLADNVPWIADEWGGICNGDVDYYSYVRTGNFPFDPPKRFDGKRASVIAAVGDNAAQSKLGERVV
jgi:D-xylulose reductase